MFFKRKDRKGFALIIVMWTMTILLIISTSVAFMMRTELKIAKNYHDKVQAYYAATAGIERAIGLLKNDTTTAPSFNHTVVINEIMFNPAASDSYYEYVELYNAGDSAVPLAGWTLETAGDVQVLTADTYGGHGGSGAITLASGGYAVIHDKRTQADLNVFDGVVYTSIPADTGDGMNLRLKIDDAALSLGNAGGNVILRNDSGEIIDYVTYTPVINRHNKDGTTVQGNGPSLELLHPDSNNYCSGAWLASFPASGDGTPGLENSTYLKPLYPARSFPSTPSTIDSLADDWIKGVWPHPLALYLDGEQNIGFRLYYGRTEGDGTIKNIIDETGLASQPSDGHFHQGVVDLQGSININLAPKDVLVADYSSPDSQGLYLLGTTTANDIVTYRNGVNGVWEGGAGDDNPFDPLEEIMLIDGIGNALFYGDDDGAGGSSDSIRDMNNHRLDTNSENDTSTGGHAAGVMDGGWEDYITCYPYSGKDVDDFYINVNTAPQDVLEAVLAPVEGMTAANVTTVVTAIRRYRSADGDYFEGLYNENPFDGADDWTGDGIDIPSKLGDTDYYFGNAWTEFNTLIDYVQSSGYQGSGTIADTTTRDNIIYNANGLKNEWDAGLSGIDSVPFVFRNVWGYFKIASTGFVKRGDQVMACRIEAIVDRDTNDDGTPGPVEIIYWRDNFNTTVFDTP